MGGIWAMCRLLGLDAVILSSLMPKSVTTAIGIALSDEIGGVSAITAGAIAITGIGGNICGVALCHLGRIKSEVAQGVAFGTASHVVGTHRAAQLSQLTGAVSSLSLTIAGLLTAVVLSFVYQ
jgi:putative effector of murein hydrolase